MKITIGLLSDYNVDLIAAPIAVKIYYLAYFCTLSVPHIIDRMVVSCVHAWCALIAYIFQHV